MDNKEMALARLEIIKEILDKFDKEKSYLSTIRDHVKNITREFANDDNYKAALEHIERLHIELTQIYVDLFINAQVAEKEIKNIK